MHNKEQLNEVKRNELCINEQFVAFFLWNIRLSIR